VGAVKAMIEWSLSDSSALKLRWAHALPRLWMRAGKAAAGIRHDGKSLDGN
jgi:hypothetical protein